VKKTLLQSLLCSLLLPACYRVDKNKSVERQAYVPVYASDAASRKVSYQAPKPIKHGGKIILYNNLLLQVEQDSGIHIFNVSNPSSPQRVGYISSPLCKDLSIKNNYLITNNLDDMVIIDLSNIDAVKEVKRLPGEFPEMRLQYPPQTGVYFVCPDPSKGIVVGWKLETVKDPQCRR
jgi:hypothetical protein